MLDTSNLSNFLKGITDALRAKKGTTEPIEHKFIDEEIASIDYMKSLISTLESKTNLKYTLANSASIEVLPTFRINDACSSMQEFCSQNKSIKVIGALDTKYIKDFSACFYEMALNLERIEGLDFSSATNILHMFENTNYGKLTYLRIIPNSLHISANWRRLNALDEESRQSIFDGLADLTGQNSQVLTLNKTLEEKITDEQKAYVVSKNWQLAFS